MVPGVMGRPIQNHEICYLKWRIALVKSILNGFYQNLAHMCQKQFSTDGTTFGATSKQFNKSFKIQLKIEKMVKNCKKDCGDAIETLCNHSFTMVTLTLLRAADRIKIGAVSKFC